MSALRAWSLKQCHDFAFEKKRKKNPQAKRAARSEQGPLRLSLDLPTLPAVACRVPGMQDFEVHFNNWTHNSGHRRAFIQCRFPAHGNCRRYTFLKNHADQATAVAWLLAWAQDASRHDTSRGHVAFAPSDAAVARMRDRQRLAVWGFVFAYVFVFACSAALHMRIVCCALFVVLRSRFFKGVGHVKACSRRPGALLRLRETHVYCRSNIVPTGFSFISELG